MQLALDGGYWNSAAMQAADLMLRLKRARPVVRSIERAWATPDVQRTRAFRALKRLSSQERARVLKVLRALREAKRARLLRSRRAWH